jgi:tetratricopeptide (TPR) repeat protein
LRFVRKTVVKVFDTIRKFRVYMLILGVLCLSFGIYQKCWYSDLIRSAVESIEANQLDQQYLEEAKKGLFSSDDLIAYNMGVRAYRADNLKKAGEHFYEVIRNSQDILQKKHAYYNLGNILAQLELPRKAAEMYKESLRLDPKDWESKYNLERLYVFYLEAFPGEGQQTSLKQEPGDEKNDKNHRGRSDAEKPDI